MNLPSISKVTNEDQARQIAIDWQHWQAEQSLSYGELETYGAYFRALAQKYPNLQDEFNYNGII